MRLSLNVGAHIAPRVAKTGGVVLPSLPSLSLSSYSLTQGEAVTINILGATATSVLTVASGALPTGLTLNSGARTITGTPSGTGTANFAIDETLGGYANSPRRNSFEIDVEAVVVTPPAISAVTLTQTSAEGATPFNWSISIPDATIYAGQFWRVQVATDSGFTNITQDFTQLIVPGDFVDGPTFSTFTTPATTFYLRMRVEQDEGTTPVTSAWSNTIDEIITDTTAPTISTASTASVAENATLAVALAANESVTWAIRTAAQNGASVDHDKFEISGTTLRWAGNGTKDFEAPNDADTNNTYVVVVRATDLAGNTTDKTITVSVTNESEGAVFNPLTAFTDYWDAGDEGTITGTGDTLVLANQIGTANIVPHTTGTAFVTGDASKDVNGLNTLYSSGTAGRMRTSAAKVYSDTGHIFFAAYFDPTVWAGVQAMLFSMGDPADGDPRFNIGNGAVGAPGQVSFFRQTTGGSNGSLGTFAGTGTGAPTTAMHLWEFRYTDNGNMLVYCDNVLKYTTAWTGFGGVATSFGIFYQIFQTNRTSGRFGSLAIKDGSVLTGTDLTDAQTFFATRWGITL